MLSYRRITYTMPLLDVNRSVAISNLLSIVMQNKVGLLSYSITTNNILDKYEHIVSIDTMLDNKIVEQHLDKYLVGYESAEKHTYEL